VATVTSVAVALLRAKAKSAVGAGSLGDGSFWQAAAARATRARTKYLTFMIDEGARAAEEGRADHTGSRFKCRQSMAKVARSESLLLRPLATPGPGTYSVKVPCGPPPAPGRRNRHFSKKPLITSIM